MPYIVAMETLQVGADTNFQGKLYRVGQKQLDD